MLLLISLLFTKVLKPKKPTLANEVDSLRHQLEQEITDKDTAEEEQNALKESLRYLQTAYQTATLQNQVFELFLIMQSYNKLTIYQTVMKRHASIRFFRKRCIILMLCSGIFNLQKWEQYMPS